METRPGDIMMWLVGSRRFVFGHAAIVGPADSSNVIVQTGQGGIDVQEISTIGIQPNWVYQCSHSVLAEMAAATAYSWYLGAA